MQSVTDEWLANQKKETLNRSFVFITIYGTDGTIYKYGDGSKDDRVISFSLDQEVDYLNDNLPKYEIVFELDNSDGLFDIDNKSGIYNNLQTRNKVEIEIGYLRDDKETIDTIKGGTFYLSEWKISNNSLTAEFTAREWLYFLTNETDVSFFGSSITSAITSVIKDGNAIKGFSDLSINDYLVFDDTNNYTTSGNTNGTPINSIVQLLAAAGGYTLYFDRENRLHIGNIDLSQKVQDYEINEFNSFEYPEITFDNILNKVSLTYTTYQVSPSDLTTLKNNNDYKVYGPQRTAGSGGYAIDKQLGTKEWPQGIQLTLTSEGRIPSFTTTDFQTYCVASTTFTSDTGEEIPNYMANSLKINEETVTVVFSIMCAYSDSNVSSSASLAIYLPYYVDYDIADSITINENENGITEEISDEFINNSLCSENVLFWVANYKNNRRIIECSFRADPRLDALDIINIYKKYGDSEKVIVESIKYTWSGGMFKGEIKARNIENQIEISRTISVDGDIQDVPFGTVVTPTINLYTYYNGILNKQEVGDQYSCSVTSSDTSKVSVSTDEDGFYQLTIKGTATITFSWNITGIGQVASISFQASCYYNSFADASWSEINEVCKAGLASEVYNIGNTKTDNGVTLYIMDFDHYYLSSSSSKTASICLGFNLTHTSGSESYYYYHSSNTDTYWADCYLKNTLIPNKVSFSSELTALIQEVTTHYVNSTSSSSSTQTATDDFFAISVVEIYGDLIYDTGISSNIKQYAEFYDAEGYQLQAFKNLNLKSLGDTSISTYMSSYNMFRTRVLDYTYNGNYYVFGTATSQQVTSSQITIISGNGHNLFVLFNIGVKD